MCVWMYIYIYTYICISIGWRRTRSGMALELCACESLSPSTEVRVSGKKLFQHWTVLSATNPGALSWRHRMDMKLSSSNENRLGINVYISKMFDRTFRSITSQTWSISKNVVQCDINTNISKNNNQPDVQQRAGDSKTIQWRTLDYHCLCWKPIVHVEKGEAGWSNGFVQTKSHHLHASFIIFSTLGDVLHGFLENR